MSSATDGEPRVGVHRKPARERFPAWAWGDGYPATIMTIADYTAAMDRLDALEQENAELKRLMQLETLADVQLRSLRAAVATWAEFQREAIRQGMGQFNPEIDLLALVPADGSWLEEGKQ